MVVIAPKYRNTVNCRQTWRDSLVIAENLQVKVNLLNWLSNWLFKLFGEVRK